MPSSSQPAPPQPASPQPAPPLATPLDALRTTFGYSGFRGRQAEVIERVMAGRHTLAVMPTGAGKSLTYQIPALCRAGTGLVISPLIALMQDQVRAATAAGIRAAALTSADEDRDETIRRFLRGELDLIYAAPERASTEGFRRLLTQVPLSLIAIDEAHCVSEWGHDFRPDYRLLRGLVDAHPDVPRLALTATADNHTRADILAQLGVPDDGLILAGFDRPNIRYAISPRDGLAAQLGRIVRDSPGPGIVYATSRDATERLAEQLRGLGRPARAYHAGLPKSIEAYYQETGRAGRDGDPAQAHLLWGAEDFSRARRRIETEVEEARRPAERRRMDALAGLVETAGCRRAILLRHFGEDPPARCGNCDNCLSPPATIDATEAARKLLSAAFRTEMRYGVGHLADVLAGRDSEKVRSLGHDRLSVFGIASADEQRLVKPVARALIARDALRADEYGGLSFGPAARAILKGEEQVAIVMPPARERRRKDGAGGAADPTDDPLFEALRAVRRDLAKAQGVPPYVIFHDATLREMAALKPTTAGGLGQVSGVGARKLEAYGDAFLAAIRAA